MKLRAQWPVLAILSHHELRSSTSHNFLIHVAEISIYFLETRLEDGRIRNLRAIDFQPFAHLSRAASRLLLSEVPMLKQ